jgi:hypothetical protein
MPLIPALFAAALAPTPPPLVGGRPADAPASVGALYAEVDGSRVSFCTASLVADDLLLTAGHCLPVLAEARDQGLAVGVAFGERLSEPEGLLTGRLGEGRAHPQWNEDTLEHDLALIELIDEVAVEPLPLFASDAETAVGQSPALTFVGWGTTGDLRRDGGVRRSVTLPVEGLSELFVYTFDAAQGHNLCSGDSGGPGLVEEDGQLYLVAVASLVFADRPGGYACAGGHGRSARIDVDQRWITDAIDPLNAGGALFDGAGPATAADGGFTDGAAGCQTLPLDENSPGQALVGLIGLMTLRRRLSGAPPPTRS